MTSLLLTSCYIFFVSLSHSLTYSYWSLLLIFLCHNIIIYFTIHIASAHTHTNFIVMCHNQHGTMPKYTTKHIINTRDNINRSMVNKIFLSYSMSFVKLTVVFLWYTQWWAWCSVSAFSVCFDSIRFDSIWLDSTRRINSYRIWPSLNRNIYLSLIWHAFRHAFLSWQCFRSIAPHLCNFKQL